MRLNLQNKLLSALCGLATLLGISAANAQTSVQNFGTGTGAQTSQTGSPGFLPAPTSGTTWARGGATAPAAPITLSTASNPLGTSGSYINGTASTSTSVAKFSPAVAYTGSTEFYTSFKVLFGDATAGATAASGSWSFYQGAGAMYSDATDFAGAQVFAGLRFTYGAAGALTLATRQGGAFATTGLTNPPLNQSTVYTIEIVGNNKTSGVISYSYAGVAQAVAVQKYDLYINGTLVGNDIAEAAFPAGSNVASTTFIGVSSTSNVAHVFVDDVTIYNAVPAALAVPAAIVPNAPVVSNPTINSLDVTIDTNAQNANLSTIEYAIQETGASQYVQADGSLSASVVWQTASAWGTKTVSGLSSNTTYNFRLKTRNALNVEAGFGPSAAGTTLANLAANLTLGTALPGFGNLCVGATATGSFTFDGANLDGSDIVVGGLPGFTFSLSQNGTYGPTINISYVGTSVTGQQVWVKFSPIAVQSYNGNIPLNGGGQSSFAVAATGSGFNTPASVTTGPASSITSVSATLAGSFTVGCTAVSAYGIEYSTTNGFTSGTQVPAGNLAAGAFSSSVSGLSPNAVYYYKAYATDGATVYGSQQSFTTSAITLPVATTASSILQDSFTANWNAVPGATGYRLDVSASSTFSVAVNTSDLLISEYVEGSSNNKVLEIYNGTGATVNLANYTLKKQSNGAGAFGFDLALSGNLANGATYVIAYNQASAAILALANLSTTSAAMTFNGNDAVALYKNGVQIDVVGIVNQFANWGTDVTLVRKATNLAPSTSYTITDWNSAGVDNITNLGIHTINNTMPSFVSGYESLAVNGTSQLVSGLAEYTDYYYRVRAVSANSTSGNSNVITVKTLPSPATFDAITQVVGTVCEGTQATFNVTGLVPNSVSTISFNIDGGATQTVANISSNASGFATFNFVLTLADNGKTLTVTAVERTDVATTPSTVTANNQAILSVTANVTYYADADADGFGNPSVSMVSCEGIPVGFVANNSDCNDSDNTKHTSFSFYVDADADGYGGGSAVSVCAVNAPAAPAGYAVEGFDCDDTKATVHPNAAEIGYNLIDEDCDGSIDEGFPPKSTVIQGPQCGVTLTAIDSYIYANVVSGAQGYRWRVTTLSGPGNGQVQFITTALRAMRLTQLGSYSFNTTYKIEVAVYFAGFLQPFTASNCTVSTPAATTQLSNCGQTLTSTSDVIYANLVNFSTGYRFRISDPANPLVFQEVDRSIREFRMNLVTGFAVQYGKTYNIEVAVKNTDGTYLPYGSVCTVTTPQFPTTSLEDAMCDDYAVPTMNTLVYAISYPGATSYAFQLTGPGLPVGGAEVVKTLRAFRLSDFTGLTPGATYNVRIRIIFNTTDVAGPYGKVCTVVVPAIARTNEIAKAEFTAVAYPNPFADNFSIDVRTAAESMVNVKVYDMTGRLLESHNVSVAAMQSFTVGDRYPSGVYNVIVSQNENVRTLRVIKR
jgi:hypothetical protein